MSTKKVSFQFNQVVTSNLVFAYLKYFSSFAAGIFGKKSVHHHLLTNDGAHFFLPIFTAAKDEKYFTTYMYVLTY